ncbi:MAG TPA: tRNA pseudouridine(38-40) synthase TruA [Methylomirabilota bacterium]|nr:tRNA pseudouridine(38-40) synthase TruA [Methylomirabilota bacterium]
MALLLEYDGRRYHGWQTQPDVPTVQAAVRTALVPLAGPAVRVVGASRTDAGVHALGQVASVVSPAPLAPSTVMAVLNARLPPDVRVLAARAAPDGFDARRAARLKRYGYRLRTTVVPSPFLRGYAWELGRPVEVRAMRRALASLRGKHDFSAFCAAPGRERDPVCTVRSARVVVRRDEVWVLLSADAFLHHMVRNVVGTVVEIGRGRRPVEWAGAVLAGRDRRGAGPTAPAAGLFLLSVRYPLPLFPGGGRRRQGPVRAGPGRDGGP